MFDGRQREKKLRNQIGRIVNENEEGSVGEEAKRMHRFGYDSTLGCAEELSS